MELIVLTQDEEKELFNLEATISRNLQSFYEIGIALMAIRDKRLYRSEHNTFEDYCRERWQFNRRHAYRLIDSAKVIENVSHGTQKPESERQARPLTKIKDPETQKKVWVEVVETAPNGRVTAKHVESVVIQKIQKQPVSDAMTFAGMAISQLERIREDDPKRKQALERVSDWIEKNS